MSSAILRRFVRFSFVSSVASLQQHKSLHSSILLSPLLGNNPKRPSPILSFRFTSSADKVGDDENLKRVLDSEIKCAQESDQLIQGLPNLAPFEIVDNPGELTITLKRKFGTESIQIEVLMPDPLEEEDEENSDDDNKSSHQPNLSLIVAVAKGGEGPHLEFFCTAYPDQIQITIDSMLMKSNKASTADQIAYEGPEFSDLDEELQKAFYQYLEVRGIRSSLTNSLHEYMVNKDSREYLRWLKNTKEFVAN